MGDGLGDFAIGTVNVTVNPVNDPPTIPNASVSTLHAVPLVNIALGGSDPEGGALVYTLESGPSIVSTVAGTAQEL